MSEAAPHIGTLRERPLHADLKRWYAEPDDRVEVSVDGYVIDLVRDDLLIEIQTRGFSGMKPKLRRLLANGRRVRIVHPIAVDRWIVTLDARGKVLARRRSPRHGTVTDLVAELVSFPALLLDPGFEIEILMTEEDEYRRYEAGRCWRRRGWVIIERRLLGVTGRFPSRARMTSLTFCRRACLSRSRPPTWPRYWGGLDEWHSSWRTASGQSA